MALAQELAVLGVFFASIILWRRVMKQPCAHPKSKLSNSPISPVRSPHLQKTVDERDSVTPKESLAKRNGLCHQGGAQATPAVRAAEQQMLRLIENREFTRALNMYRALERDGRDRLLAGEDLFTAFIQSAIRVGKIDVVERMLRTMKRNGIPPSLDFWRTTLKMLSSRKHFGSCLSIYNIFRQELPADKVVFSCLINAALDCGTPECAGSMLERYQQADLEPKDHILLLRTYVALGDVDAAEEVFDRLGIRMTTLMVNLVLLACVNAREPERAWRIISKAHELEKERENAPAPALQQPSTPTAAEGSSAAEEIGGKLVDVVSYNTAIKGFAQADMSTRCFDCLQVMRNEHGLEPDDVTFGTLLDVCIADNNMGKADDVVNMFISGNRQMDTMMCTLFIKGLVRANCLPRAMELYDEMKSRAGSKPDVVTYSVLIKAFVDTHDLQKALLLVEDMQDSGHAPDDIIITHLLEGCRHEGNHTLGVRLFKDMVEAGVKPSEFTLIAMVKLHGRCGAHDDAHDLVATWQKLYGARPSVIHFTCLMSGCLRTKHYDLAWAAYELMLQSGVSPDELAISTLLPGMVAAQQWDHVLALARRALKGAVPIDVPVETLNNALSQMVLSNKPGRHFEQLSTLMKEAGIPITTKNAKRCS